MLFPGMLVERKINSINAVDKIQVLPESGDYQSVEPIQVDLCN